MRKQGVTLVQVAQGNTHHLDCEPKIHKGEGGLQLKPPETSCMQFCAMLCNAPERGISVLTTKTITNWNSVVLQPSEAC